MGIIARRRRAKADNMPTSEHLENGSPSRGDSPNSSTNEGESTDTEKIEVINSPSRVRPQEPAGTVGDLKPWPPSPVEERKGAKHDLAPWAGGGAVP